MRNTTFRQLSYEEAIARKAELEERKRNRPKSKAAVVGAKKTRQTQAEHDKNEEDWKLAVRTHDDYHCQYPGCRERHAHIHCHHVAPRSQRKDLIYVVTNGKCLCSEHHTWVHDHPIQAIAMGLLSNRSRELAAKEGTLGVY